MTKTVKLFALMILALAIASASTHTLSLFQASVVNGTELQPGDYKLSVENNKAILIKGKAKVEIAVTVETNESKFPSTSVRYNNEDGKYKIREIRLGGTTTKLIVN